VDFYHLPCNLNYGDWHQCHVAARKNSFPLSLLSYLSSDKLIKEVAAIGIAKVVHLVDSTLQPLILD
jgi:hypothetical protein